MVWAISSSGSPKIRIFRYLPFQRSLFLRIGLLVTSFTGALILVMYFVVYYSFSEQDTILDTHECYYYSEMVASWGMPPDTLKILHDLRNLKMMGGIYKGGQKYWSYPADFDNTGFSSYSDSDYLGRIHDINIPLYVAFGDLGDLLSALVINGDYDFYLTINWQPPSDLILRFIPASILTLIFMIILFSTIRQFLMPIQLMRWRILALEQGDLRTQIPVKGDDELASLTRTINKLINEIRVLLSNKQQLLADVSHELRTPLTRMQLLLAMIPRHKNITKLKQEIHFLESMISNLLMSDKLSMPYADLDLTSIRLSDFIENIVALYPTGEERIVIRENIPATLVRFDQTKLHIALRNLIDNALKYGSSDKPIEISGRIFNSSILIVVRDFGKGIPHEELAELTKPFYRVKNPETLIRSGFGLGLSITRKIAEAHQGRLIIESKLNRGSTFSLAIPAKL